MRLREFVLERDRRLSESRLWGLQRRFFDRLGPDAWAQQIVPQYITSNPWIAATYAKLIFGWLRDWCMAPIEGDEPLALDLAQPVHIVELGCGSGRFAYHFLIRFFDLLSRSHLAAVPAVNDLGVGHQPAPLD